MRRSRCSKLPWICSNFLVLQEEHHKKSHHCDDSEDYSYTSTPTGQGEQKKDLR